MYPFEISHEGRIRSLILASGQIYRSIHEIGGVASELYIFYKPLYSNNLYRVMFDKQGISKQTISKPRKVQKMTSIKYNLRKIVLKLYIDLLRLV